VKNADKLKFTLKLDFREREKEREAYKYVQFQNAIKIILIINYYKYLLFVVALNCIKPFLFHFCQTSNIYIYVIFITRVYINSI